MSYCNYDNGTPPDESGEELPVDEENNLNLFNGQFLLPPPLLVASKLRALLVSCCCRLAPGAADIQLLMAIANQAGAATNAAH